MAHTLAYCLPIGNLMLFFDPDFLAVLVRGTTSDDPNRTLLRMLTQKKEPRTWPGPGKYANSQVLILDHRRMYCGSSGDYFELVAEIDTKRQRVIPFLDPVREVHGDREDEDPPAISETSLLIDRRYLSEKAIREAKMRAQEKYDFEIRAQRLDRFMCKSLLSLNLVPCFVHCVRHLQGLPTAFEAGSMDDDE
jgi:hypothetical protein